MFHQSKALCARSTLVLAALLLVVAGGLAMSPPTYAQGPTPQPSEREDLRERQFKREQDALARQQDRLNKAATRVAKAQSYLDELKSKGKDTTALAAALATFNSQVAVAQSSHNTAANLLNARLGFDASGQVTNLAEATQTVTNACQALRDAQRILRQAMLDLARTIRSYRRNH